MEKEKLEELVTLYALGELTPEEKSEVDVQIQHQPILDNSVKAVRGIDNLLEDYFDDQLDEEDDDTGELPPELAGLAPPQNLVDLYNSVKKDVVRPFVPEPITESVAATSNNIISSENVMPEHGIKSEKSKGHLAHRLAFSVAALALIAVVGALLYPQLVSKDIHVAMRANNEESEFQSPDRSGPLNQSSLNADNLTGDNLIIPVASKPAENNVQEHDLYMPETAGSGRQMAIPNRNDLAEDDFYMPGTAGTAKQLAAPNSNDLAGDEFYMPETAESDLESDYDSWLEYSNMPGSPERATPQFSAPNTDFNKSSPSGNNAFDPSQFTPDRMPIHNQPTGGSRSLSPKPERSADVEEKKSPDQKQQDSGAADAETASVSDSYATLRKNVLEENKLPNPEDVKVDQWLNYFGVSELVKTTEDKNEGVDKKDIQFAKAIKQFGEALSSSEPADVKAFEEVLNLLKDSVGDDAKRLEFKSIVEKTIEMKKKLSE